jgi:hypothetical protein
MGDSTNNRETGARKYPPTPVRKKTDTDAALPRKPEPYGLTEAVDETPEKTRKSDGVDTPRSPD